MYPFFWEYLHNFCEIVEKRGVRHNLGMCLIKDKYGTWEHVRYVEQKHPNEYVALSR